MSLRINNQHIAIAILIFLEIKIIFLGALLSHASIWAF